MFSRTSNQDVLPAAPAGPESFQVAPGQTDSPPASVLPPTSRLPGRFLTMWVAWFRHLTILRRILSSFGLVFLGILILIAGSYRYMMVVVNDSRLNTRSHGFVQVLNNMDATMESVENGHRRYLV